MIVLLVLATLAALLVGYAWHRSQYWSRRSIPGPKPQLFVGNLAQLGHPVSNPLPFKLAEWTKQYGKVYGIQRGAANLLVISDYDMARQVFHDQFDNFYERDLAPMNGNADKKTVAHVFNTRGLRWKRLRTLTSLVFTTKSLKRVFPIIVSNADKMCENLDEDLKKQSVIDISKNLKEYTASVILRSAFGRKEDRELVRELIDGVLESVNQLRGWMFQLAWICPTIGPVLGLFK
ncbi:putative cytochrome P450 CYP13A8 [Aphelenchoides bicaudatus]|nr:putative cytochrome P450 CYP13A8 [Aphelenchoides bicaudatus]